MEEGGVTAEEETEVQVDPGLPHRQASSGWARPHG